MIKFSMILICLLLPLQNKLVKTIDQWDPVRTQARTVLPTLEIPYTVPFFKWITAGYWPAAVEGMWIGLLQEAGQSNSPNRAQQTQSAASFYRLATDLDPYFYELYDTGTIHIGMLASQPQLACDLVDKAMQAYREKVLFMSPEFQKRFWSHPYTLLIYQAYLYAFELQDWTKAKAAFLAAAAIPGAPAYLIQMQKWLKEEGSESKLAVKILKLMINTTADDTLKQVYNKKLKQYE
jgi:hypothetical protein